MPTTAKWGPKAFLCDSSKIVPFSGLKITQAAKTETQSDADGDSVTNIKGKDALNLSFSAKYLAAAGTDPYAQMEEWLSFVGQSYPLYVGGKRIGPATLTLQNVEVSNTMHTNSGAFLGLEVALSFQEYATEQTVTKSAAPSGSTWSQKKSAAMSAGASKLEKSQRSPSKAKRGGVTNDKVVMLN